MTTLTLFTTTALVLGILAGCAPKASTKAGTKPKPASAPQEPEVPTDPTNPSKTAKYPFTTNNVASMTVVDNNSKTVTIQSIAQSKELTVFQFSGVTCAACQISSPRVKAGLAEFGNRTQVVVLFPNKVSEYSTADYKSFVDPYSKGSRFAVDKDMAVLRKIRKNNNHFFGLYILVKQDGTTYVFDEEETDPALVIAAAKEALNSSASKND
jgi:hypothetical protein